MRVGIRCDKPGDLDDAIKEMIDVDRPVIFDCVVDQNENCFPMIPSGRAHNEMLLGDAGDERRRGRSPKKARCWCDPGQAAARHAMPSVTRAHPRIILQRRSRRTSRRHTLSVLVDNEPGVLARVIGLFSGRGYNIDCSPCRRPSTRSISRASPSSPAARRW